MFGLPLSTTLVAFGIPVLIAAALVWRGLRGSKKSSRDTRNEEDSPL
ncbi:MAG: hypothetical protein JW793_09690 [Acidobacteria bacterium]|nr:hypothetical protein [Acidobacteriota bacterium]